MLTLRLTPHEAREIREALLETRRDWSPTLDRVTKEIQEALKDAPVDLQSPGVG